MNLAKFSIKNSLLVNFISFFFIIAGIIAYFKLNREAFPTISFGVVMIQTAYSGATPGEIEKLITIPLEKELRQVDHIDELTSFSAEGYSVIELKIDPDEKDASQVINNVQRAVDRAQDLPDDLEVPPLVRELSTADQPVIALSISGDMDEFKLQQYAKSLERKLLDIDGVAKVIRDGWRKQQIRVEIKPEVFAKLYLSLNEVIDALRDQNISLPGGNLTENNKEFIIRTAGEFESPDAIKNVIVRSNTDGTQLRLGDIAQVTHGFEDITIINKTNGAKAITLTIVKRSSGDTIDIVDAVKNLAKETKFLAPDNLQIAFLNDTSYYIQRRLGVLVNNGLVGFALVLVCLFTFLSWRVALSTIIGIPTTVLATLTLMHWMGISINLLSMFGMIMVSGMLVDEEIIISENIFRHMETNQGSSRAILDGIGEVAKSVIATVLTTVAGFFPLMMMSGTTGKYIKNIPVIVIITLLCSLTMALVILPAHIQSLTRNRPVQAPNTASLKYRFTKTLLDGYASWLQPVLRFRYLFSGVLLVLLAGALFHVIHKKNFVRFPSGGIEIFFIRMEGEPGDELAFTEEKLKPIEEIIAALPAEEMDSFSTLIGKAQTDPDDRYSETGTHLGQVTVFLTPANKRERSSAKIIEDLRPKLNELSSFKKISFEEMRHGPPAGKVIEIQLSGDEFEPLQEIATAFKAELDKIPGVVDIRDDADKTLDEIRVQIDHKMAAQAKVSVAQVAQTVRTAFDGFVATTIKKTDEEIDVVVKFPLASRSNSNDLQDLLIKNQRGDLIPLNKIAQIERASTRQAIKHVDALRTTVVSANVDENERSALSVVEEVGLKFDLIMAKYPGYVFQIGGEQEELLQSLLSLIIPLCLAVIFIAIILIAVFRSIRYSLIIIASIPFAAIGVILAFEINSMPYSIMALIGLIGLIGVVANSGIIIVDFIQQARLRGMGLAESIVQGARLRFRSVMLTSITTALGVIPAAYGIGGLDPFVQPMALTLNYGLLFGTVISLFLIPCLVAITDDVIQCFKNN